MARTGLTEIEEKELKELRIEVQELADKISVLEPELIDVDTEIRALKKWKKGRGIGFFVTFILFIVLLYIMFKFSDLQFEANVGRGTRFNDVFVFSVSTTVLVFAMLLLAALAIFSIILGVKVMIEVGSSKSIRAYAKNNYKKNYYNEIEICQKKENDIKMELIEMKRIYAEKKKKMDKLAEREIPWYDQ